MQDSYGTQNQPHFAETGAPQIGTDLTQVSDYAALVGNRKVGTTSQRTALTGADLWTGLSFYDTTLKFTFVWDGTSWTGGGIYNADISASVSMASGWTFNNAQSSVCGALGTIRISVTKATTTIAANTTGNIANQQIGSITDSTLWPLMTVALASDNTGYTCSFYIQGDGTFYIGGLPPGIGVSVGDAFSFSGSYVRAVV